MVTVESSVHQNSFLDSFRSILGTTDHKMIGKMYLAFAAVNFVLSGLLALIIRLELVNPGKDIVNSGDWGTLFTTHGVAMIFLVIFPLGAAVGNYLLPLMLKADDLYWPRWNNIAFWMLVPGAFFIWVGLPDFGWTGYTPLSTEPANASVNMWIIGLLILGVSSVAAAVNFIVTIALKRSKDISWLQMDLFSWSIFWTSLIQVLATPIITTGLVMLLLDRNAGSGFFSFSEVNGSILWQHVFWAYSHPAVYIMILPAMGLTSLLISKFTRRPIFGHVSMIVSMGVITLIGFLVWGHHMFTTGVIPGVVISFTAMTYVITVPSGIKTFNWVASLYGGNIKLTVPMLFAISFVLGFILGGFTGVFVNIVPIDVVLHDTYWVVGHFHYIVLGGSVSAAFGAFYYLLPHMTGRMYHRQMAFWQFVTWTLGFLMTFGAMAVLGTLGMPRRYYDYADLPNAGFLQLFHQIATVGAFLMAFSFLILLINILWTILKGPEAGDDPFNLNEGYFYLAQPHIFLDDDEDEEEIDGTEVTI